MARYYFDLRDGNGITPDQEGLWLDGLDAAEREATREAAEEALVRSRKGLPGEVTIEVRDETGIGMMIAMVAVHVKRRVEQPA